MGNLIAHGTVHGHTSNVILSVAGLSGRFQYRRSVGVLFWCRQSMFSSDSAPDSLNDLLSTFCWGVIKHCSRYDSVSESPVDRCRGFLQTCDDPINESDRCRLLVYSTKLCWVSVDDDNYFLFLLPVTVL